MYPSGLPGRLERIRYQPFETPTAWTIVLRWSLVTTGESVVGCSRRLALCVTTNSPPPRESRSSSAYAAYEKTLAMATTDASSNDERAMIASSASSGEAQRGQTRQIRRRREGLVQAEPVEAEPA
jgi:hypothetical protein